MLLDLFDFARRTEALSCGPMRKTFSLLSLALAIVVTGCGSRDTATKNDPPQPTDRASPQRPKLLVIDQTQPATPAWTEVAGRRVYVLPADAFTTAKIAMPVRATKDGSLTGNVTIIPDSSLWARSGGPNTSASVVTLVGEVGQPINWARLPVKITSVVIRNSDGSLHSVQAKGWLVDASDETMGVICSLEVPDFTAAKPVVPTVSIPAGHAVVVMLEEAVPLGP